MSRTPLAMQIRIPSINDMEPLMNIADILSPALPARAVVPAHCRIVTTNVLISPSRCGMRYGKRVERDAYLALFHESTMQHDATTAAEALGVDVGTARRQLQALVKTGVLKARAGGWHRSGKWYRLA
jgi:hypothetical protein